VPGLTVATGTIPTVRTTVKLVHDTLTKIPTLPGQSSGYSVPAPYPAQSVSGGSADWQYDPALAIQGPQNLKKGLQYTISSFDATKNLTEAQYQASGPLTAPEIQQDGLTHDADTSQIPNEVKQEAVRVIGAANAKTPIDKARALQAYFQNSKQFKYSLTDVPPGDPTGRDALLWMLTHKSGYCQYFASSMAAMARSVGIPARVAIGFTAGQQGVHGTDPSAYTVTTHDYHVWPELYFDGIGWLRF
jgi:transglutaminase-like putative cysteine protease